MPLEKNPYLKDDKAHDHKRRHDPNPPPLEGESECRQCMAGPGCTVLFFVSLPFLFFFMIGIDAAICPSRWNSISTSVSLAGVDFVGSSSLSSSNFTFNVHIELLARYDTKYGNTTLFLRSRDGFEISGARVGEDETRRLDVSVKLVSRYRFNGSTLVYSDPVSDGGDGVVRLRTHVTFSGEGRRLAYKVRPVARATCELSVDLRSRALVFVECAHQIPCRA